MADTARLTVRIDEGLNNDISSIALEKGTTVNACITEALMMYRDAQYMEGKASVISDEILKAIQSEMQLSEQRMANRQNKLLSEMAISLFINSKALASKLGYDASDLERFRVEAVEVLKNGQTVYNLSDFR